MALTYIQAESSLTEEKKRKKIRLLTSPKPSVIFIFLYVSILQISLSCNLCDSSRILDIKWNHYFSMPFCSETFFFILFSSHYLVNFVINFIVESSNCVMLVLWVLAAYSAVIYQESSGCLRGVMVKAMDCGIVVREFVLQSRYYVHFRANTLRKGMNPLILPAMG